MQITADQYDLLARAGVFGDTRVELRVDTEGSVRLDGHSMPEPDIVVWADARIDGPIPLNRVWLVVEVASSTLGDDLGAKRALTHVTGPPNTGSPMSPGRSFISMPIRSKACTVGSRSCGSARPRPP